MAAEPVHPEPVLCNGRGHSSERHAYHKTNKQTKKRHVMMLGSLMGTVSVESPLEVVCTERDPVMERL